MKLEDVITAYVTLQRSLGLRFISSARLLRQYGHTMGDINIDEVQPDGVVAFLLGTGALSATCKVRYSVLCGLYKFATTRGYVQQSPLPPDLPTPPRPQSPYVYSTEELRRLIEATPVLHVGHSRQQAAMYRTLILLLYSTGLRIGEALGLTVRDVNLIDALVTVRNTKFYKTRLVPIGPKLTAELACHLKRRRLLPLPEGEDSKFFTSRTGRGWAYQHVITLFQHLRTAAKITCPPGEIRPPRLHDLRHTAAVHRVVAWYRSGQDVQRLLPNLATYLGHLDLRSTQRYLHMTPDLLDQASRRFAQYAQQGERHE